MTDNSVTEKLEKLNVSKNKIEDRKEELVKSLDALQKQIKDGQAQIRQLEADVNATVGAIAMCNEFLKDENEDA